jgi:hypothetical protein
MTLLLQLMNTWELGIQTRSLSSGQQQYNQSLKNSPAANKLWKRFSRAARYHALARQKGITPVVYETLH